MILRLFSGDKVNSATGILVFTVLMWLPGFLNPVVNLPEVSTHSMPFYSFLETAFNLTDHGMRYLSLAILLLQSYFLFLLNGRFILIQERTFLPAFLYIAILSFYPPFQNFSESLIAAIFIIFVLALLFDSYSNEANSYRFFEAGLLLGIASLFYSKSIFFLPFIWISSMVLRPFYWREWVLPILGLVLPYLFIFGINFLLEKDPWMVLSVLFEGLNDIAIPLLPSTSFYAILGSLIILTIVASIYMLKVFQFRKVYIRNYFLTFFWLFIISLALFVFSGLKDTGVFYFIAIPISFILSNYFINSRNSKINHIIFSLFILLLFLNAVNHIFKFIEI